MISTLRIASLAFLAGCALTMVSLWKLEEEQVVDLWWHTRHGRGLLRQRALSQLHNGPTPSSTKIPPLHVSFSSDSNGVQLEIVDATAKINKKLNVSLAKSSAMPNRTIHDERKQQVLLSVPFYVYEDLLWIDKGTVGDLTVEEWMNKREVKHTDDYWFATAALRHPMRTLNPSGAQLFIVPTLLNEICDQLVWIRQGLCVNDTCDVELMEQADQYLARSTWFQRHQGRDHVLVASHYLAHQILQPFVNLAKCNVIGFEDQLWNAPNRITLPSTYVGNACPPAANKTHDFALVASIKRREGHRRRANICTWLQQQNDNQHYSVAVCGPGDQCPSLAQAKFGFHVQGDTLGSQRLMDTLISGTVPIFTHMGQYDILPSWIDWSSISFHANTDTPAAFSRFLHRVLQDKEGYRSRMEHILLNGDLFDWTTAVPFDLYMYTFARQIVPEKQRKAATSPYSVLLLDRVEQLQQHQNDPKRFISCGEHEAPHCGLCAPPSRPFLCRGQCMWCEFGAQETDAWLVPLDRCVPKSTTCRPLGNVLVR